MPVTPTPTTTAVPATGTAISRLGFGLAVLVLSCAACGSSGHGAFAWLRPQPPPTGWPVARTSTGAELAYPPDWRRVKGDPGTVTAALLAPDGRYVGYLNVTPRQGAETLADWSSFRIEHNTEEGDRAVTRLAAASGLRFLTGRGSCVKDSYTTAIGAHYIEIACLVSGAGGESVIVGAAPPSSWSSKSTVIMRAISGFRA